MIAGTILAAGRPAATSRLRAALGTMALLAVWEVLAYTVYGSSHLVPPPQQVVATVFHDPGFEMWPNLVTTLSEAAAGFVWGNAVAIGLALAFVQVPFLEKALLRLVLATYCIPVIAIGPILEILLSGTQPQITLSGLSVLFTTLIACLLGLRSVDTTAMDLVKVYGGGRWSQLVRVRLRSALPAAFAGLAISGPAALLGAIVGEYIGASQGLGLALSVASNDLDARRAFAIALVATAVAGAAYLVVTALGRLLVPWAPRYQAQR